jgi:hypothetical protein
LIASRYINVSIFRRPGILRAMRIMRTRFVFVAGVFVAFVFVAGVFVAGGCSGRTLLASAADGGAGAGGSTTPTRLVPWQVEAAGTAPLVIGIYDTQEQVHCRFALDAEGQLRCLPSSVATMEPAGAYADQRCGLPIFRVQGEAAAAATAGRFIALPIPSTDCAPVRHFVGKLAPVAPGAIRYGGSPCAALSVPSAPVDDGWRDLAVVDTQPPTRWATGTEVDGPRAGGRVRLRQIVTEDGTRFDDHLVDEHWGRSCTLESDDTKIACWPPTAFDSTLTYEGDTCEGTQVWGADACAPPAFIGRLGPTYYALGPAWPGAVFEKSKGCLHVRDAAGPDARAVFFERGAPLGADALATLRWDTSGTGRFARRGLRGDDGGLVPLADELTTATTKARFHDSVAGADCNPIWTPEGRVRCVPTTVTVGPYTYGFFADAWCTTKVYLCTNQACAGRPAIETALDANGELRPTSLRATKKPTAVYSSFGGDVGCVPLMGDLSPYYTLEGPLPWDMFPALGESHGRASGAP